MTDDESLWIHFNGTGKTKNCFCLRIVFVAVCILLRRSEEKYDRKKISRNVNKHVKFRVFLSDQFISSDLYGADKKTRTV